MRTVGALACVAFIASGCGLVAEDRDNGLVIHLSVEKRTLRPGETFVATATLENTTDDPLAVHYLDVSPEYMTVADRAVPVDVVSQGWRRAYDHPAVLRPLPNMIVGSRSLLGGTLPGGDRREMKEACEFALGGATCGDFYPTFVIPARSSIRTTRSFRASGDRNYVDVGLFVLRSFFTPEVLEASERVTDPNPRFHVKFRPKIWVGSLYVGVRVNVR